jgi:hypothetical protein
MWMNTPNREISGKMICSFVSKREMIARKAVREELLSNGAGESWYVGYDVAGNRIPYALIVNSRVEWYASPLSEIQKFALKRRLNRYAAFL